MNQHILWKNLSNFAGTLSASNLCPFGKPAWVSVFNLILSGFLNNQGGGKL